MFASASEGVAMPVIKERMPNGEVSISVTDESGAPVAVVSSFLAYLSARECSPNTIIAYAHDLSHWWEFLGAQRLSWYEIRPGPYRRVPAVSPPSNNDPPVASHRAAACSGR